MGKKRKLRKNASAIIASLLLTISTFIFPLFGTNLFGEIFSNKNSVMINFISRIFISQNNINSTFGVLQFLEVIIFLIIFLFYLLNGFGLIYNRYSRYASYVTILYLIVGLIMYNLLNLKYSMSLFGINISSISLGPGIYFVPILGISYLIFYRRINHSIRL